MHFTVGGAILVKNYFNRCSLGGGGGESDSLFLGGRAGQEPPERGVIPPSDMIEYTPAAHLSHQCKCFCFLSPSHSFRFR